MINTNHSIVIIGAGPAGLAIAGRLRKRGIDFTLFEASDQIAHSWQNHYDRLHLHTVKQWSHLPHMPFPESYPLYVPRELLINYFESYAETYNILPRFNKNVSSITKSESGQWNIQTTDQENITATTVIISTGVNRIPNIPSFSGQETFSGDITHSKSYKNAKPFIGKDVLVVGMGNTGAEIALDLSEHDINTTVSLRGPVNIVPRDLNGRPVQVTAKKLAKLPFGIGTSLGTLIRRAYIGDLTKYGVESPKMSPTRQLLESGKTPIVDIGTVAAIKQGRIKIMKEIENISNKTILFKDGNSREIDTIILATGYKPLLEEFIEKGADLLDSYGCPSTPIAEGYHKNLYFLGFDNYKLGGILGIIMDESNQIADHIENQIKTYNK